MKTKILGQVFTPNHIVQKMLKMVDYDLSKDLTDIKIIDNSCGNGAFLQEIVQILIEKYGLKAKKYIQKNVFGIEIDKIAFENCIAKLNDICSKNNIFNVQWNIINENTVKVFKNYQNKFDIVIGNPPYVRIHNTQENIKEFNFCKSGMTDLYIAFYEMSLNMLKSDGKLCFINPSSIFHSKAGFILREHILKHHLLVKLIDFKHQKIFNKISTYSCIILLDRKNNKDEITFNNETILKYSDFSILGNWYFDEDVYKLKAFRNILLSNKDIVKVKNGVATLCDSILICDFLRDFKSKYISDIIKCSTLKNTKAIFPYDENFELVDFNKLDKNIQDYLKSQETKLKIET